MLAPQYIEPPSASPGVPLKLNWVRSRGPIPDGAKPRTSCGPIWKWSSMRRLVPSSLRALPQKREDTAGRITIVVERVVAQVVADHRGEHRTLRELAPNRQRGLAIGEAV